MGKFDTVNGDRAAKIHIAGCRQHYRRPPYASCREAEPACAGCGRTAAETAAAQALEAQTIEAQTVAGLLTTRRRAARDIANGDLSVIWLVPTGPELTERRYCVGCAPTANWSDLACDRCGDGPLLVVPDSERRRAAHRQGITYLVGRGWTAGANSAMICPHCT